MSFTHVNGLFLSVVLPQKRVRTKYTERFSVIIPAERTTVSPPVFVFIIM
jgi:hypothetical protein